MPKSRDELGSQNNPTGNEAGGILAGTREVFNSASSAIRGFGDSINEAVGAGSGRGSSGTPIVKPSQLARRTFHQDINWDISLKPFLGFQYFVKVNYNGALKEYVDTFFPDTQSYVSNFPLVKNITLPSIGVNTEIFNEYNRKRISQTKLDFNPVKIVFHDVVNGNTLKLWQMYYQYYFADGRYTKSDAVRNVNVNPADFNSRNFGSDLGEDLGKVNDIRYLYKTIEIFQVHGDRYNKVTLYNPRIVNFEQSTMDYSSNELVELTYTIDYEWAEYELRDKNRDNSRQVVTDDDTMKTYFRESNILEYAEFSPSYQKPDKPAYPDGFLGTVAEIADTVQAGIDTINEVKGLARNVAGKVQSISALGNQIQKDILGVDEPPYPLPDVRGFTSRIDDIPTNAPDIRRVRKGG